MILSANSRQQSSYNGQSKLGWYQWWCGDHQGGGRNAHPHIEVRMVSEQWLRGHNFLINQCRCKYMTKDTCSWIQCINASEHKWALQMRDLADAYLVWKDGSTDKEFTIQHIDIFGEYCLCFSICWLTPWRFSVVKDIFPYQRAGLWILEHHTPSSQLPLTSFRCNLYGVFTVYPGAVS